MFGDGKGAIELMGNWLLGMQGPNAADGKGSRSTISASFRSRPSPAARASSTDTLGGINGWLVTKGAPKEAVDFLKFFCQEKYSTMRPPQGRLHPGRERRPKARSKPARQAIAADLAATTWHQNFFDQDLGPSVGRVVNDISVAVAAGEDDAGGRRGGACRTPGTSSSSEARRS